MDRVLWGLASLYRCLLPAPDYKTQPPGTHELTMEHGRRRNWKSLECRGNDPEWQRWEKTSVIKFNYDMEVALAQQNLPYEYCLSPNEKLPLSCRNVSW
jgi:hypothetical protein